MRSTFYLLSGVSFLWPSSAFAEEDVGEIVVTATKTEVLENESTTSVEVISSKQISAFGIGDLTDLLQQLAGVNISRSILGASPALQGLDPKHTLVLVDGQRLLGSKNGIVDLSRISLSNIERIEIVRGASSVLYGSDAMGGVINIITKRAKSKKDIRTTYQHGLLGMIQADAQVGKQTQSKNHLTTVGFRSSDGYDLDVDTVQTDGPSFRQVEVSHKHQWTPKEDFSLGGSAAYLFRDSRRVQASGMALYDQANRVEDANIRIQPMWRPSERSILRGVVRGTYFKEQYLQDQRRAVDYDSYQENIQQLGVVQLQHDISLGSHVLTQGFESQTEYIQSDRLVDNTAQRQRFAFFFQDQSDIQDAPVKLHTGIRMDVDSWFGSNITPNFALRYDILPNLLWRASYGMGYRAPSFREMFLYFSNPSVGYVVEGNPDLQPEHSQSLQTELEYRLPGLLKVHVNIFRNDLDNLISVVLRDEEGAQYQYDNLVKAFTTGAMFRTKINLGSYLSVTGTYNFLHAIDVESQRFLEGRAKHTGVLGFRVSLPSGMLITCNASGVGARYFYFDQDGDGSSDTVLSDPYTMVNVRLARQVGTYSQVFLGANNLFNQGDTTFLPIQPLWAYAGFEFRMQRGQQ